MEYILTQREYKALKEGGIRRTAGQEEKLQQLCTLAANYVPAVSGIPVGCILTNTDRESFCDNCPASEVCPCEFKSWSQ